MGRWFFGCPAYQSGPGKDCFRVDVSMASQSSFSRSPENPSAHFTTAKTYVGIYIYIYIYIILWVGSWTEYVYI